MQTASLGNLLYCVLAAGDMARREQPKGRYFDRAYKSDGTVVTAMDKQLDHYLRDEITKLFPKANVLTEESKHSFDNTRALTLVVDPIDGTEGYSQGMHYWCISVGILDKDLIPVGGIVYSPRLDLLFVAEIGKPATLNGVPIAPNDSVDLLSAKSSIMVSSMLHQQIDLTRFPARILNIGSAALRLCFPLIYPGIFGTIESRQIHIWDMVGAHAINRSLGFRLEYQTNGSINYADLVNGSPVHDIVLAGSPQHVQILRHTLERLSSIKTKG